uniref:Thioredoxin-like protein AAED1 n=1 Tax=Seriola lalandi dorsalis TaxID=1841481 RepID=A0A3B4WT94_SERLL
LNSTLRTARPLRVLVVSFGSLEGAQLWLEQTGCTFDMLLDPQRKIYRSFGLGSSYAKVMKFDKKNYIHAALMRLLFQMGGDFLLDEAGKVLLSHPSKTPMDRLTVKDILQAVAAAGRSASSA